jgi:hypothetical protein
MEHMLRSENPLVWHLETALEAESILEVYNKLGKTGEPFAKFAFDILRYSILDVATHVKMMRLGLGYDEESPPPQRTVRPKIKFKVSSQFYSEH